MRRKWIASHKWRQTGSENWANLAGVDVLTELYEDRDDVRSIVYGSVLHQRHSSLVMFAQSRRRTFVTESREYSHETALCRHAQTHRKVLSNVTTSHRLQEAQLSQKNRATFRPYNCKRIIIVIVTRGWALDRVHNSYAGHSIAFLQFVTLWPWPVTLWPNINWKVTYRDYP